MTDWQPGDPLYSQWDGTHQLMITIKYDPIERDMINADAARWSPGIGWRHAFSGDHFTGHPS